MHLPSALTLLAAITSRPSATLAQENMVPREFITPNGLLSTVYINRDIEFIHTPRANPPSQFSKRVVFTPGYDDYCGETNPTTSSGADAPLTADCTTIKQYMETITGYYTVSPSDFDPSTRWATVVSSVTCRFAIQFQLAADTKAAVIGTNDVHFYTQSVLQYVKTQNIEATGSIACYNNGTTLYLNWGMIHV